MHALAAAAPSLAPGLDGFRLILHVLAATIWVGGQLTVAGLLPTIRRLGDDAPKTVARAFGRIEWPAFAVLVLTGFWNLAAVHPKDASAAWNAVMGIKMTLVVIAGVAVFLHQRSTSRAALAAWGAIGALASVGALCLGVFLAG
jgi:putative copper export protein